MNLTPVRRLRPWLGTYVAIEAMADDAQDTARAIEAAYADVAGVHAGMSFHSAGSDLARLHRHAHQQPVAVGWHTWSVLAMALALAHESEGVFDPTVAPALVRGGALPCPDAAFPDQDADWRDIELLDDLHVRFQRPVWIDLGGIAKGYAVDLAVETLLAHGVRCGTVNAGGDLRVFGDNPEPIPVAVRNPVNPADSIFLGALRNRAVATSGEFFLGRPGDPPGFSPIVHPLRGVGHSRARSVTVIAEQCAIADGLTKVVSLIGPAAEPLLTRFNATAAIIDNADSVQASAGFWQALGHAATPGACHA